MIFCSLGATDDIGASCHFLKINDTGIVLDSGTDPDEDGPPALPNFDLVHEREGWYADHALISHAHHDHMGSLPVLIRHFPRVLVHMTRATRSLLDMLLPASARLQERRLKEGSTAHEPLFDEEDAEMHSSLYLTHDLEKPFDVTSMRGETPVKATFYDAGHVLGSTGILLTHEDERVFYTSDTNLRAQSIIPGGSYPEEPVDVLIMESTMASDEDAELTTRRQEEQKLADGLERTIGRGGTALVPVFALGRAQEVLALVNRFKRQGRVPQDTPVYTAGIMRGVAELYDQTRLVTPRLDEDFRVYDVEQRRLPRSASATRKILDEPSIHVVTSGMMFEYTASNRIAQELIEDEKNAVLRVGYAVDHSPAHRLLEASRNGREVVLDEHRGPQEIRCEVDRFRLSGHSHRMDLIQLVERLKPGKVILVHGETEARAWMAENIRRHYPEADVVLPERGEPVEI